MVPLHQNFILNDSCTSMWSFHLVSIKYNKLVKISWRLDELELRKKINEFF